MVRAEFYEGVGAEGISAPERRETIAAAAPYQHIYMSGVEAALDELHETLARRDGITISTFALAGEPSSAIVDFARRMKAGFIAVGRHGHALAERLLTGSTTRALLRDSPCPVLVTPADRKT